MAGAVAPDAPCPALGRCPAAFVEARSTAQAAAGVAAPPRWALPSAAALPLVAEPVTPAAEDDVLLFDVDLPELDAASGKGGVEHAPLKGALEPGSACGKQAIAAVRQLLADDPDLAAAPERLGRALVPALPSNTRIVLRTATPKPGSLAAADPTWPLRHLRHTTLVITTADGEDLVVEPSFRDHITLPGSSPSYQALVASVPDALALNPTQLYWLLQQMGARIFAESQALGRALAPWRTTPALMSKFLPRQYQDVVLSPPPTASEPVPKPSSPVASAVAADVAASAPTSAAASLAGAVRLSMLPTGVRTALPPARVVFGFAPTAPAAAAPTPAPVVEAVVPAIPPEVVPPAQDAEPEPALPAPIPSAPRAQLDEASMARQPLAVQGTPVVRAPTSSPALHPVLMALGPSVPPAALPGPGAVAKGAVSKPALLVGVGGDAESNTASADAVTLDSTNARNATSRAVLHALLKPTGGLGAVAGSVAPRVSAPGFLGRGCGVPLTPPPGLMRMRVVKRLGVGAVGGMHMGVANSPRLAA